MIFTKSTIIKRIQAGMKQPRYQLANSFLLDSYVRVFTYHNYHKQDPTDPTLPGRLALELTGLN